MDQSAWSSESNILARLGSCAGQPYEEWNDNSGTDWEKRWCSGLSQNWRMNEGWVEQTLAANHTASYFLSILGASSFTSSFIYAINLCPLPGQLHFNYTWYFLIYTKPRLSQDPRNTGNVHDFLSRLKMLMEAMII